MWDKAGEGDKAASFRWCTLTALYQAVTIAWRGWGIEVFALVEPGRNKAASLYKAVMLLSMAHHRLAYWVSSTPVTRATSCTSLRSWAWTT